MKKKKLNNTTVYYGKKFTYAFNEEITPMLLLESFAIPPTGRIRVALPVKDKKTAEQIIKLLEE